MKTLAPLAIAFAAGGTTDRWRKVVLALAFALATGGAQAGTMYRWVDEKGVTHFSEDPPPDGKAQKIDVKPLPSSSDAPAARPQDWRARELELRQKRLDKEKAERKSEQDASARESRCLRAQRALDQLNRQRPLYEVDKQGNRVYIDDRERAAEAETARKAVEANCR